MLIMVLGYFLAEALFLGLLSPGFGLVVATNDLALNAVQGVANGLVFLLLSELVRRLKPRA
jgi:hypothetical protein